MADLLRRLNILDRSPSQVYGTNIGDAFAGTRVYDNREFAPFFGLPLGLTPFGASAFEVEKGKDFSTAKLKARDTLGEGMVSQEVSKGIDNPELLYRILYQQPLAGGEMSAQATYGTSRNDTPVKMLELQYLREILKNLGFGAYHQQTPQGSQSGLRMQGRF